MKSTFVSLSCITVFLSLLFFVQGRPLALKIAERAVTEHTDMHNGPHKVLMDTFCACRQKPVDIAKLSMCAKGLGDAKWCSFRVCAPGWECTEDAATHRCQLYKTSGNYRCDIPFVQPGKEADRCLCTLDLSEKTAWEPVTAP